MGKCLRWIAVVPSAIVAWVIVFVVSLYLLGRAERLFCPAEFLSSSGCYVSWWRDVERGATILGASLAGVLVVVVATVVAPSHKKSVAWWSYGAGAVVAVFMGLLSSLFMEMMATLLAGGLAAVALSRMVKSAA
jgi:hypothetical protein